MRGLILAAVLSGCGGADRTSSAVPFGSTCPVPSTKATAVAGSPVETLAPTARDLVLRNVTVIDGSGAPARVDQDVLLQRGRITAVSPDMAAPMGVRELDFEGHTVLPGFIDAHVHMTEAPAKSHDAVVARSVRESDADRVMRGAAAARATLAAGFTTVRNLGGSFADRSLRDAIEKGLVSGPRMLVANYAIGITGGHCDHTNAMDPRVRPDAGGPEVGVADGPDQVRRAVRYQMKHGADVIKICATGGVMSQGDAVGSPQMTLAEMKAAVEEAVRADRRVAAHAHGNLGIVDAVKAGVHSIEHGSILDERTVALMVKRGTYLVPTLYVGAYVEGQADAGTVSAESADKAREIAPRMRKSFKLAYDRGVSIALGSDAGVFRHGLNGREFAEMVSYGMKPMDAIVAGTRRAAELLGVEDIGQVKPGFVADIVVVEGDPIDDIRILQNPVMVIQSGTIVVQRTSGPGEAR